MFIIWGSRAREITEEQGDFHCPECQEQSDYKLVKVASYFTLYFIPLFQTKVLGHYVECYECGSQFQERILDMPAPSKKRRPSGPSADDVLLAVTTDLEAGTPIETMRTKMVEKGIPLEEANSLLNQATGGLTHDCQRCRLTYIDSVDECPSCGSSLYA